MMNYFENIDSESVRYYFRKSHKVSSPRFLVLINCFIASLFIIVGGVFTISDVVVSEVWNFRDSSLWTYLFILLGLLWVSGLLVANQPSERKGLSTRIYYVFSIISAGVMFIPLLSSAVIGVIIVSNVFYTIYIFVVGVAVPLVTFHFTAKLIRNGILRLKEDRINQIQRNEKKSEKAITLHYFIISMGIISGPTIVRLAGEDNFSILINVSSIGLYYIVAFSIIRPSIQLYLLIRHKLTHLKIKC